MRWSEWSMPTCTTCDASWSVQAFTMSFRQCEGWGIASAILHEHGQERTLPSTLVLDQPAHDRPGTGGHTGGGCWHVATLLLVGNQAAKRTARGCAPGTQGPGSRPYRQCRAPA